MFGGSIPKTLRCLMASVLAVLIMKALPLVSHHGIETSFMGVSRSVAAEYSGLSPGTLLWPHETSDLQPEDDIYFGKLENGFRFVLMQNQNPEKRVSMHLNVQAGSFQESDEQQGLAHFLEHMLFCGSENFPPGELIKYFQSIGMQFGPDANAHTGFYETVYDILLPEGDEENLRKGLLVMKDYAQGALLEASEIERERKVILAEKRTRDSASYRTFEKTILFELPDARISQRLPIGSEDVLQQATRADLKAYYDTWYRPDNMILVAVGAFEMDSTKSLIQEYFGGMAPREKSVPAIPFGEIVHHGVKTFHHYEKESGSATVTIEVLTKVPRQSDTIEARKEILKQELADQIVQNRLDALIGREGVPGTSAAIGSGVYLNNIRYAMITAEGEPQTWKALLTFLEQTLRKALQFGFFESELDRVKQDFLSQLSQAVKEKDTRESKVLARTIIRTLNANQVLLSPEYEESLLAPFIRSLTLKDLHETFKKTWQPDHRLVLLTGNVDLSAGPQTAEDQILYVYKTSRRETVTPPVVKQAVVFPYLPTPQGQGRFAEKTEHQDIGVLQIDFANGFRLNLKKTDFKADEILATLSFGGGRHDEPVGLSGLSDLSVDVVNESGLGSLTKDELETALAGKQSRVSFGIHESVFAFNGSTVPEELELFFQLMYAHLLDPGFRLDAYRLVMNQFKNRYEEITHTLEGVMTLQGERFLAGDDSRFGLPPYTEFTRLSLADIRQWIEPVLAVEPLELSIVGDFNVDEVITQASRYFGTLPTRTDNMRDKRKDPVFPAGRSLHAEVDTEIPSGLVYVSYPTEDIWDIQRTRRFAVLSDIFTERMRVRIREKLGEAYSPFAYHRPYRAYKGLGLFNVVVEVNPANTRRVIDEIKKIAADISRNGVTADEIHRSLEPTLNSIKDMRQRNDYWLKTVLRESKKHPQQIEWSRHILEDYSSITTDDVQNLAKAYLVDSRAAVIEAVPIATVSAD